MKKFIYSLLFISVISFLPAFATDNRQLRDYDGWELPKGSFVSVISAQEISTQYCDVGSPVRFISTSDLYLYETNIIPQNTDFLGYIEKINEPIVGTNASMIIKVSKIRFPDGYEMPMKGYISIAGSILIGGELTEPAKYEKKISSMQGFYSMTGYVPGPVRKMGIHKVIAAGADLTIVLAGPLYITHTVTN